MNVLYVCEQHHALRVKANQPSLGSHNKRPASIHPRVSGHLWPPRWPMGRSTALSTSPGNRPRMHADDRGLWSWWCACLGVHVELHIVAFVYRSVGIKMASGYVSAKCACLMGVICVWHVGAYVCQLCICISSVHVCFKCVCLLSSLDSTWFVQFVEVETGGKNGGRGRGKDESLYVVSCLWMQSYMAVCVCCVFSACGVFMCHY